MQSEFTNRVLEQVRLKGPVTAKQFAVALQADRSLVNQALYGPLRGEVRQYKNYRWSLATVGTPEIRENTQDRITNVYRNLFQYYLDCLSHDADKGVRVFADSRYELDYVELSYWPLDSEQPDSHSAQLQKLIGRQRREARTKVLWLGYPALLCPARSRSGWEGVFLEPVLLWPQDAEARELRFLPEPTINPRALERLGTLGNVLEEVVNLTEELGLDSSDGPPLDELVARLRDLRPEWDWKEQLAPAPFRQVGELRQIPDRGIYNAAVVILADRSPFTVGLEKELAELRTVNDESILRSSLGVLLGAPGSSTTNDQPLLEPAPLNAEQRSAVQQALSEPLTVITGPPGTGKSQVVTAILVNAAWRGLRVLFASKNNKAVDVVIERTNALTARPFVLRLGTRSLQTQLADHIVSILSAKTTDDERIVHAAAVSKLKAQEEKLNQNTKQLNELISFRNTVDYLDHAAEQARILLPDILFQNASDTIIKNMRTKLDALLKAMRRSERNRGTFSERLFWRFLIKSRLHALTVAVAELRAVFASLALSIQGEEHDPFGLAASATRYIDALTASSEYQLALNELLNKPDIGVIAGRTMADLRALAEVSAEVWLSWAALLQDRLSAADRAALGDYAAVLRTISQADQDGGTIARQV